MRCEERIIVPPFADSFSGENTCAACKLIASFQLESSNDSEWGIEREREKEGRREEWVKGPLGKDRIRDDDTRGGGFRHNLKEAAGRYITSALYSGRRLQ